jgi:hypothetical protein
MERLSKNKMTVIATLYQTESSFNRVQRIWIKYETELRDSIRRNGKRYTLARYKESYAFLRNLTLQLPTNPIPFCKVDSEGIPKTLWTLRPLFKGDRNDKRVALSIARSYEEIRLPIDYTTDPITASPLKDIHETDQQFGLFLERFCHKYPWYLGSLQTRSPYEPRVFTTLSKGPNGPAVSTAHLDAKAVKDDARLYNSISDLNRVLGQSWITDWMDNQARSFHSEDKYITGRLGFSAEPGGKTRIFAIGDYWSQTSLKVIQDSLYNTLKGISTDCTANQSKGFKSLLRDSLHKSTYCFDLTSASDRIPAIMQKHRLKLMGGNPLADAWHSVMTDRTFQIKPTGQSVSWKVGQPLGLLSSFPSFALWHHDIIQYSANLERISKDKPLKFFKDYRLLGDDVVIFDKKVAGIYHHLLTEVLGIPINLSKSVIGDERHSQIEFIKRFALDGKEMSSIKNNILTKSNMINMLDLIDILIERDFISPDTGCYDALKFLIPKEFEKFQFMLWVRSSRARPFEGANDTFRIDRDSFETKLKEKRSQNMQEKTALIDKYLNEAEPLDVLYKKSSLPHSRTALGLENLSDPLKLHPLVWAVNQTGLDLSIALSSIWMDDAQNASPVEYLPIVSTKSYFPLSNERQKNQYLSELILSTFEELREESLSTKDTQPD